MAKSTSKIHAQGIVLFLFIPLVLFLFLQYPFGILPSLIAGIVIMFAHRFIAKPFLRRYHLSRCLWCGRTSRPRQNLDVRISATSNFTFQCCETSCLPNTKRFFDFADRYKMLF